MKISCCYLLIPFFFLCLSSCKSQVSTTNIQSITWESPEREALIDKLSNDQLQFMGGLELVTDDNKAFGGLSSMHVNEDGKMLMAISDYSMRKSIPDKHRSHIFRIEIDYYNDGTLKNAVIKNVASVIDKNGEILQGELESIASIDGNYYASLDNGKYRADSLWRLEEEDQNLKMQTPIELNKFPSEYNREGFEALTEMDSENLFLIHERLPGKIENSMRFAWIVDLRSGTTKRKEYRSYLEEIKGACQLDNGDFIILEKTFNRDTGMNRFALFHLQEEDLKKDTIKGKMLIDAGSKYLDNFEGISSFTRGGEDYLLICSDNNGDWNLDSEGRTRQKTLLLLFKLK